MGKPKENSIKFPCPFCSGGGIFHQTEEWLNRTHHYLLCSSCGMRGPLAASEAEAIAKWDEQDTQRDARDAARYRWIRDGNAYFPEEQGITGGEDLDALIDSAMDGSFYG